MSPLLLADTTATPPADGRNLALFDCVRGPGWDVMPVAGRSSIIRGEERVVAVNVAPSAETPDCMADR